MTAADLVLASSSRCHPGGPLDHLLDAIAEWAEGVDEVLFVPWARTDHADYTATIRRGLARLDLRVVGLEEAADPASAVDSARAVFVGGGNTFLLLDTLQRRGVLPVLRERVTAGTTRYLGISAGSNLACPTIQTTNDMPIVWPAGGPDGLGAVAVQLNAHYVDPDPTSTHQGETRPQRIAEFHQHHTTPVLGLREHAWLRVRGDDLTVRGVPGAARPPGVLLRPEQPPQDLPDTTDLAAALAEMPSTA